MARESAILSDLAGRNRLQSAHGTADSELNREWRTRPPLTGLLRTIDDIVSNPDRSRMWKVIDVVFMCFLWFVTGLSLLIWLDGNAWTSWSVLVRILVPITLIATARSWYQYPRRSRRSPTLEDEDDHLDDA
jgi:hypothetical protein